MSEWFTDEELDRIDRFAASPGHSRDPTMLLPEGVSDDAVDDEDEPSATAANTKDEADAADEPSEE